jgi:hypothetical protein
VTGSFAGTESGDSVTNITDISVAINGAEFSGPLTAWLYTDPGGKCGTCYANSGAYASFDPLKNNFSSRTRPLPRAPYRAPIGFISYLFQTRVQRQLQHS